MSDLGYICPNCGYYNNCFRDHCRNCDEPSPDDRRAHTPGNVWGGLNDSEDDDSDERSASDTAWTCAICGSVNGSGLERCANCDTPPPPTPMRRPPYEHCIWELPELDDEELEALEAAVDALRDAHAAGDDEPTVVDVYRKARSVVRYLVAAVQAGREMWAVAREVVTRQTIQSDDRPHYD